MDGYNGDMVTITSIHVALLIILIYSGQEPAHLYCRYAPACVLGTHECCVSYHHGLGALPFLVRVPFFPWQLFGLFFFSHSPFSLYSLSLSSFVAFFIARTPSNSVHWVMSSVFISESNDQSQPPEPTRPKRPRSSYAVSWYEEDIEGRMGSFEKGCTFLLYDGTSTLA